MQGEMSRPVGFADLGPGGLGKLNGIIKRGGPEAAPSSLKGKGLVIPVLGQIDKAVDPPPGSLQQGKELIDVVIERAHDLERSVRVSVKDGDFPNGSRLGAHRGNGYHHTFIVQVDVV